MAMRYDVLDTETGNLYGRFQTEDAALAFVDALIAANGDDIVETLALGGRDDAGGVLPVTAGAALVRLVLAREADRDPLVKRG